MRLIITALMVAAVSLAACGRKQEAATTVAAANGAVTVTTRDGDTVTTQTAVPVVPETPGATNAPAIAVETPAYAPLYPGATVKASSTTEANDHQVGSVTYKTTAAPQTVIDYYKPKVADAGFEVSEVNVGVGVMLAGTDTPGGRSLQVIATAEKSGTAVVLSWTSPKS